MNEEPTPDPTHLDGNIRPLVFYPNDNLRTKSVEVPEEMIGTDELRGLVKDMISTMYATGGVGLSAIQVGVPLRLFVMDPYHNVPGRPSELRVCVNPILSPVEDAEVARMKEGCLSFPGLVQPIPRPNMVRLQCKTHLGAEVNTILQTWPARIAQHEVDHLNGKLMIDQLNGLSLRQAKKAMAKFKRQVTHTSKKPKRRRG